MVKFISRTWAERDDPIFTGRFTCSSLRNIHIFNKRNQNEKISKSKSSNFQKNNPDSYKTQNDKGRATKKIHRYCTETARQTKRDPAAKEPVVL